MKILLHIGQSKTGTSAIQAYLTLNREALEGQGVLYPVVSVGGMPIDFGNHNPLADSLAGLSRYPYFTTEQYFETFFKTAEKINAGHMILSAEHFFGGEPRVWDVPDQETYFERYRTKITNLAPYLASHNVTVLVYLRPQIDWLASAISQTVRIERLIRKEPIYINDRQFFNMVKPILCYYTMIKTWAEALEPKKVTVVSYDRAHLYKNSSIADFLLRADLKDIDLPYASENLEVNQSISRPLIEVKKELNRQPHSKNTERVIIACMRELTEKANNASHYWISKELANEVEDFVKPENEKLNAEFIDGPYLEPRGTAAKIGQDPHVSDEEISTARELYKKEIKKPKYKLLKARITFLLYLRDHALPFHSTLHQIKRFTRRVRFGKSG